MAACGYGGFTKMPSSPSDVQKITNAAIVGFRRLNIGDDGYSADKMVLGALFGSSSSKEKNSGMFAMGGSFDETSGEPEAYAHPGAEPGIALLAVQSTESVRRGRGAPFCAATDAVPDRKLYRHGSAELTYFYVFGLWPFGTDGQLFYVHECWIRGTSAAKQRSVFTLNGVDKDEQCFLLASLPGTEQDTPQLRPRVLSPSDIKTACAEWGDAGLCGVLLQMHAFALELEDTLVGAEDGAVGCPSGLSVAAFWTWMAKARTSDDGRVQSLYRSVVAFCNIDDKREQARGKRYKSARKQHCADDDRGYLDRGYVQPRETRKARDRQLDERDPSGTMPPFFVFELCLKLGGSVRIPIRANQLRVWMLYRYVHGLMPVYGAVLSCPTIRPPPAVLGGKARVHVPSRFLMALGLRELRVLWAILYSPISLAAHIRSASGDADLAEQRAQTMQGDTRALDVVFHGLSLLDVDNALQLCNGGSKGGDWPLHMRDVLYALTRLCLGPEQVHVATEASVFVDAQSPLSAPLVAVPYYGFYALQTRSIIDTLFAKSSLPILACAPSLSSTALDFLGRVHKHTLCLWTYSFARVAVLEVDGDGRVAHLAPDAAEKHATVAFTAYSVDTFSAAVLGKHLVDTLRTANVSRNTPLAASAVYDYLIAPHGAVASSVAAPGHLHRLQALSELGDRLYVYQNPICCERDERARSKSRAALARMSSALGVSNTQDAALKALAVFVAPSIGVPHSFVPGTPFVPNDEHRPLAMLRLPAIDSRDAFATTARFTCDALSGVFIPSAKDLRGVEYSASGSTGIFASAIVGVMAESLPSVFSGAWLSIGSLLGGNAAFWHAVNWLIAIGAVAPVVVPQVEYDAAATDINPPAPALACRWADAPGLGLSTAGIFAACNDDLEKVLPPPAPPAPSPPPDAQPAAAASVVPQSSPFAFLSWDMSWGPGLDEGAEFAATESAPVVVCRTASTALPADWDPVLCAAPVVACSRSIGKSLAMLEARCERNGLALPLRVQQRARAFIEHGVFPPDPVTEAVMSARCEHKNFIINARVVSADAFADWVARPDLDMELHLGADQAHALESLVSGEGPAIRTVVGRAGTGKTALMRALAFAFGVADLAQVLFLANMNVNVQDWTRNLGPNGRVATISSYLYHRSDLLCRWLKKHREYVESRMKENKWPDVLGGATEFRKQVDSLPLGATHATQVRVVCIEEAGNVSDRLMRDLLEALCQDFPSLQLVVFFGDIDQLDPVEAGAPYAALVADHARRGLLLRLEHVHHTKVPLLLHTALVTTHGAASQVFVDYVASGCTLVGKGITTAVSTDPALFTKPPTFHFDAEHGLALRTLAGESTHSSRELDNEFRTLVVDAMRNLHSEDVLLLAFRLQERNLLNDAARTFRRDASSAITANGQVASLISGDTAMPTQRMLDGRMAKNTPVVVLGFASFTRAACSTLGSLAHGSSVTFVPQAARIGFEQAAFRCKGPLVAVLVVERAAFFAGMRELVQKIAERGDEPARVLRHTDLSDNLKYSAGAFVPVFADFKALRSWPRGEAPFFNLAARSFGSQPVEAIVYQSDAWKLGYASTGAAAQGSRASNVLIGILRRSPFYTWRLLNVMLTRAVDNVVVVAGFRDASAFLHEVIVKRNIRRTNVLAAFLRVTTDELLVPIVSIGGPKHDRVPDSEGETQVAKRQRLL